MLRTSYLFRKRNNNNENKSRERERERESEREREIDGHKIFKPKSQKMHALDAFLIAEATNFLRAENDDSGVLGN